MYVCCSVGAFIYLGKSGTYYSTVQSTNVKITLYLKHWQSEMTILLFQGKKLSKKRTQTFIQCVCLQVGW